MEVPTRVTPQEKGAPPEVSGSNRTNELILSTALRAARMCAWEWNLVSREIKYSDNAPEVLGQSAAVSVQDAWAAVHHEDAVILRVIVDDAVARRAPWSAQFRWTRPDTGEVRWMEVQGSIVRDTPAAPVKATGVLLDITDRKNSEDALAGELAATQHLQEISTRLIAEENSELLYQQLLDAAIAIMHSDFASMQMLYPERGENGELRLLAFRGFSPQAAKFWEWVPFNSKSTSCGTALRTAKRVIVRDVDKAKWMSKTEDLATFRQTGIHAMQSTPLVSRSGKVVGVISTHWATPHEPADRDLRLFDILARQAADLIERRRAEEELRESKAWLAGQREALEATLNGSTLETALGILVGTVTAVMGESVRAAFFLANPEGTTLHHVVGMGAEYAEAVDGFRSGPESLACGLATHTGKPVLTTDVTKEPLWQPWLWLAEKFNYRACWSFPIRTEAGKFVGALAIYWPEPRQATARDRELADVMTQAAAVIITRHNDAEVRRRAEEELRRLNQDLEQFAFSATHDLREPLRTIKAYSELLSDKHGEKFDGEAGTFLAFVQTAADRMGTLIDDLLNYVRVTNLNPSLEASDAGEVLAAAIANLNGAIEQSHATIANDALPTVGMDATHLVQLFQNLIGNAIKYGDASRAPAIHIGSHREGPYWIFSVRDNGIGIPAEHLERIFGLFERLHPQSAYSGTGIGLAICQRIVQRYGGRIWVESRPGRGSTFFFSVPAMR